MNIFQNILSDLVEKRLWPIAAILVAMLVAVPMTLAKPGEPTSTATVPPPVSDAAEGPELSLTRASTTGFARAPRVNDKRVDPFGARYDEAFGKALKAYLAAADDVIDDSLGGGTDVGGDTGGGGGGGGTTDPGVDPVVDPPKGEDPGTEDPEIEYEKDDLLTVLVTAGEAEPTEITDIRTLSPLPDTANPFLVYVAKTSDDKASFLVSADVTVTGDGTCAPSPTDCRTLTLGIGDTADFVLLNKDNAKVSVTVTDLETKKVAITGDDATEEAAQLESETRAVGAKALKSVIRDEEVLKSLAEQGVKLRH